MTIKELYQYLNEKYKLVCFVDLADMSMSHGAIFSLLKSHRKESYDNNERLVFYSSQEVSQDFVNHLQRAFSRVDISNFFVLICSRYDLTEKLQKANDLYGYDDTSISCLTLLFDQTKSIAQSNFLNLQFFCPLPFSSVHINGYGKVIPCCKYKGQLGNIYKNNLDEIFNGQVANNLRTQMSNGVAPPECEVCWHQENHGLTSLRKHAIDKFQDLCDHDWVDNIQIRNLEVSPMILCNFKCRICSPVSSSQIAVEELKFTNDLEEQHKLKTLLKINQTDILDQLQIALQEIGQYLRHLHIMGGEPFLAPQLEDFLKKLIHYKFADRIQLEFNTNASVWPEKIVTLFNDFNQIEILLSVDNIGSRFEIERGGSWAEIKRNIENFAKLKSSKVNVKLAVTVNIQNLLYLDDLINFSQKLDLDIVWCYLESPDYLCIDNVTKSVKQLVYQKYRNHSVQELQNICNRVQNTPAKSGQPFIDYMDKLDLRRNQQFSHSHKEIYAAMKATGLED